MADLHRATAIKKPLPHAFQSPTLNSMNKKIIDGLLALLIVASGAFIVYRLAFRESSPPAVEIAAVPTEAHETPPPLAAATPPAVNQVAIDQAEMVRRRSNWKSITSEMLAELEKNGGRKVPVSAGCALGLAESRHFAIERKDVAEAAMTGLINIYLGDRNPRCYRTGSEIELVLFDRWDPNAMVAAKAGVVKIVGIFDARVRAIPDSIFSALGVERSEHSVFFGGADPETILIYQPVNKKPSAATEFPPIFPRVDVLDRTRLAELQKRRPDVFLVDARSVEEVSARRVLGAVNIPVNDAANLKQRGPFATTRAELSAMRFDVRPLLENLRSATTGKQRPVVVIGDGTSDLRPMALLLELQKLRVRDLYWLKSPQ